MKGLRDKSGKMANAVSTAKDTTLIDASATVRGTIVFAGRLYVSGLVEGQIEAEDGSGATLVVSEGGRVQGDVRVPTVVIAGRVEGDVHSSTRLEMSEKAQVSGKVFYNLIEMQPGAAVEGELHCVREGQTGGNAHRLEASAASLDDPDPR